jgi:hypothetical protein
MIKNKLNLPQLNFPEYEFNMESRGDAIGIFDPVRKKYVTLTPEEWVRQHVLLYLAHEKKVPLSLMGVEKKLKIGQTVKRFDVVVFSSSTKPVMLIECKAPQIQIREEVFNQAARYNLSLKTKYFLLTNGLDHFCCRLDYNLNTFVFIQDIPDYSVMLK